MFGLDGLAHTLDLVGRQIVHDDDIAAAEGRSQHCSTHALKIVPFMGRSISMDVSMRSWRSAALERALAIKPDFSPAFIDRVIRFRNPDDRAHYLDGLRKAGLPE